MSFSDTPSEEMLLAMSIMLVILPVKVQSNCVNYEESRTVDYTAQVKISILWAAKFLRFS